MMQIYFKWLYVVLIHIAVIAALAGEAVMVFGLILICLIIGLQDIHVTVNHKSESKDA